MDTKWTGTQFLKIELFCCDAFLFFEAIETSNALRKNLFGGHEHLSSIALFYRIKIERCWWTQGGHKPLFLKIELFYCDAILFLKR